MLLRICLALSMTLGMSFAHAQDLEDNGAAPAAPMTEQHDDFNGDVDKAAAQTEPKAKSKEVAGASTKKGKKAKTASKKKRDTSSVAKKKGKKHSKKKKKHT